VKRINYLVTRSERLFGVALPRTVAVRLRRPLSGLAGALLLVGVLHAVQHLRLADVAHTAALDAERLAATDVALRRVQAVENDVVRLRALVRRVDDIQRSGARHAAAIAAIGNRVPGDAWLSAIRAEHRGFALEGRGARLSAVAATMAALATLPAARGARLLDVHGDRDQVGVTYAIALETHE
jgi:Tfp pilus assembly protein PilN